VDKPIFVGLDIDSRWGQRIPKSVDNSVGGSVDRTNFPRKALWEQHIALRWGRPTWTRCTGRGGCHDGCGGIPGGAKPLTGRVPAVGWFERSRCLR